MRPEFEKILDSFCIDLRRWVELNNTLTLEEVEKLLMINTSVYFSQQETANHLGVSVRTIRIKIGPVKPKYRNILSDNPRNEYQRHYYINKKAKKNPQDYLSCNECDRTFSKRVEGRSNQYYFELKTECPFCGSKDYENYAEL